MAKPIFGAPVITVQELQKLRQENSLHLLLDIRDDEEVITASITGAKHIPMHELVARKSELPKDRLIVVMCHHGGRGAVIVNAMRNGNAFNALNLEGGIDAWSREIDPSVPRY